MKTPLPSVLSVALCLIACGSRPAVEEYDDACSTHDDCVVVSDGCAGECNCGSGALSVEGAASFDDDVDSYCAWQPPKLPTVVCECVAFEARCIDGACERCEVDASGEVADCG